MGGVEEDWDELRAGLEVAVCIYLSGLCSYIPLPIRLHAIHPFVRIPSIFAHLHDICIALSFAHASVTFLQPPNACPDIYFISTPTIFAGQREGEHLDSRVYHYLFLEPVG